MTKWFDIPTFERLARLFVARIRRDIELRYPSVALEISPPALKLFRVVKNKEGPNSFVWATKRIDDEVAVSKMLDFEIRQPAELAREIERMLETSGSITDSVSVLFPESAARVVFMDADSFPRDKQGQIDMVRWKLSGKLPYPADIARITYETYYEPDGKARVMACAVKDSAVRTLVEVFKILGIDAGFIAPSFFPLLFFRKTAEPTLHLKATSVGTTIAMTEGEKVLLYRSKARSDAETFFNELRSTLLYAKEELGVETVSNCYAVEEGRDSPLLTSEINSLLDMPVSAYPWPETIEGAQALDDDARTMLLPLAWLTESQGDGK